MLHGNAKHLFLTEGHSRQPEVIFGAPQTLPIFAALQAISDKVSTNLALAEDIGVTNLTRLTGTIMQAE